MSNDKDCQIREEKQLDDLKALDSRKKLVVSKLLLNFSFIYLYIHPTSNHSFIHYHPFSRSFNYYYITFICFLFNYLSSFEFKQVRDSPQKNRVLNCLISLSEKNENLKVKKKQQWNKRKYEKKHLTKSPSLNHICIYTLRQNPYQYGSKELSH